ncbi:MAG: tetratricopeptide repeat protein [Acidobacteria bacterium]|nr:tetratricopeptide repeat protein [Acidobacteriota bacterium]
MKQALLAGVIVLLIAAPSVRGGTNPSSVLDGRIAACFRDAFNLDRAEALAEAHAIVAAFPDEPRAHRALAAVVWLDVIFQRGAVTVDHYMGGVTKSQLSLPKPSPALDAEFRQAIDRAVALANARLRAAPRDVQARYDLGSAYGLLASYQASVEGSMASAFLTARRAFDAQEDVLERDPAMKAAGVVVGTYRYVVAGLGLPSRMFAYMLGFGGDKQRGIALIESAAQDATAHVEATLALVLIYSREGRHADAVRLLHGLAAEYPRNRILVLEEGSALLRAGRQAEGEAQLTRGLEMFERDPRPKIPGERALWLYKRGLARTNLRHLADAAADLHAALDSGPENWVRGRIRLALGRVSEMRGQRPQAIASYETARTICGAANDPLCVADANRALEAKPAQAARP